jgi:hypothetical protein
MQIATASAGGAADIDTLTRQVDFVIIIINIAIMNMSINIIMTLMNFYELVVSS